MAESLQPKRFRVQLHISPQRRLSVCLSVVCHIRAPCLNGSTDLDAIWQIHLWGRMTPSEEEIWGVESLRLSQKNCKAQQKTLQLQIAAATWRIKTRSDSAFPQITLDLLQLARGLHSVLFRLELLTVVRQCKAQTESDQTCCRFVQFVVQCPCISIIITIKIGSRF